jgi:hypothetical protein
MAENDKADNAYEGVHTAPVEDWTPKDPRTIPPNEPRPLEVGDSKHLFGTWSD